MSNDLVTIQPDNGSPYAIMPVLDVRQAMARRQMLIDYTAALMVKGRDFGKIPGAGDKPTLLKPGAEKLASLFGLSPLFETVESVMDWTGGDHDGEPFFYIRCRCTLTRGDQVVGQGLGSCNSWEKKYRYRNNGKNPNPADLVNTIDKMAQKRALVAAVLIAVNASEFFTQDVEDYTDVIDGEYTTQTQPTRPATKAPAPVKPAAQPATATEVDTAASIDEDIAAAAGREFVPLAARLLEITEDAVKARMKELGYSAIPGKPEQRVTAFHALRERFPAAAQSAHDEPLFELPAVDPA